MTASSTYIYILELMIEGAKKREHVVWVPSRGVSVLRNEKTLVIITLDHHSTVQWMDGWMGAEVSELTSQVKRLPH